MSKNILKVKNRLVGHRPGSRSFRKSSQGNRLSFDLLEERCVPSLTVLAPGYAVDTFATPPSLGIVKATGPDSIAVDNTATHVFVGYNNGTAKDGTDNAMSTIVEGSSGTPGW